VGRVITLQPRTEPSDRPLRAVLYLRVSTAEQAATDYERTATRCMPSATPAAASRRAAQC
jgi:hypothetical protein